MLNVEAAPISETLEEFLKAYLAKDLERTLSFYAESKTTTVIGTGADEYIVGSEAIGECYRRDFEQSAGKQLSLEIISQDQHKDVAWVACKLKASVDLPDGGVFVLDGRMTATLVNSDGAWKMVQSHLSAPMAGQEDGQAFCDNG